MYNQIDVRRLCHTAMTHNNYKQDGLNGYKSVLNHRQVVQPARSVHGLRPHPRLVQSTRSAQSANFVQVARPKMARSEHGLRLAPSGTRQQAFSETAGVCDRVRGISNVGNTCYANSALQCFLRLPLPLNEARCASNSVMAAVWEFARAYCSKDVVDAGGVVRSLHGMQRDFSLSPCDAQECLLYLMQAYHASHGKVDDGDLNVVDAKAKAEWVQATDGMQSAVYDACGAQQYKRVKCGACGHEHVRCPVLLHVPVMRSDIDMLNRGVMIETLPGYVCETCGSRDASTCETSWHRLPPVFVVFFPQMDVKLREHLRIPNPSRGTVTEYVLCASINHYTHISHYTSDVCIEGVWHECDDHIVSARTSRANKGTTYVGVYVRLDENMELAET